MFTSFEGCKKTHFLWLLATAIDYKFNTRFLCPFLKAASDFISTSKWGKTRFGRDKKSPAFMHPCFFFRDAPPFLLPSPCLPSFPSFPSRDDAVGVSKNHSVILCVSVCSACVHLIWVNVRLFH